jgi:hypothetical protein
MLGRPGKVASKYNMSSGSYAVDRPWLSLPPSPFRLAMNVRNLLVDEVRADLAAGVDPNEIVTDQNWVVDRPIRTAVYYWQNPNAKEIVKMLLRAGADPNLPNPPPKGRNTGIFKNLSVQDAVYEPELMRLLLLDPDTKIKVDPNIMLPLVDTRNLMFGDPPRWPPGPYPLREYVFRAWSPPVNFQYAPIQQRVRDEVVAMVDKAIHNRAVDVKKALNQTSLPPDVLRIIAAMDNGHIPKPERSELLKDEPVRGAYGPKPKPGGPGGRRRRRTTKGKKRARKTRKSRR